MAGDTIGQTVSEQHGSVAKLIVFQLAGALLCVLRQPISSCKNAQSGAFNLVYDRRNSECNDR
jgi:hypothetical protein